MDSECNSRWWSAAASLISAFPFISYCVHRESLGCCKGPRTIVGTCSFVHPPPNPTNNFVLKNYSPNESVCWTHRSVPTVMLSNCGDSSLGTRYPIHSMHNAMEASN